MEDNITKLFYNTNIPKDWSIKKIKDISNKVTDGEHATPKRSAKGFYLLSARNIQDGWISLEDVDFVDGSEYERIKKRCNPESGDILISCSGTVGRVTLVPNDLHAVMVRSAALIKPDHDAVNNVFLQFALQSLYLQKQILNKINKGAQANLFINHIENLKILVPPQNEQLAIAHILGLMDSIINQNNQLIAKKELRKKWLMQNLLTGKKRLKGFDGEWKKMGAGEIFKSVTVKGCENEELLSATQDRGIIPRTMLEGRVTMPDGTTASYKLVEPGDFVISLRSFQGGLEYSYYHGIVSPAYIVLKPRKKINDEFYKQYYKSYEFIGRLAIAVIGIRDGKQISYDDYCIVKIPDPSIEEQTAIAQVLQAADKEIQLLKAKTDKLREQKKGMMQVLLTGKKRLTIDQ